jgi:hypothetical protein
MNILFGVVAVVVSGTVFVAGIVLMAALYGGDSLADW